MLSDEEKKAINHLTEKMKYHKDNPLGTYVWLTLDEHYVRTILNLIEKQSKEIEELKEKNKGLIDNSTKLIELQHLYLQNDKNWEDKIKAKIEELDKAYEDSKNEDGESEYYYPNYTIEVLQSLLEKE